MNHVWIDSDMGFDDLAAILTVQNTPGWQIDGLSLVAGNAPIGVVVDNALRSAAFFKWDFPIHQGAGSPLKGELATAQAVLGADAMRSAGRQLPSIRAELSKVNALQALGAHLGRSAQPVRVLALGPLTNLAHLLQSSPSLSPRVGQLVWMGGSAGAGNHTAAAEFNAAVDPEAVQIVLDAKLPLQMVGLDACRQVRVYAQDAHGLREGGTPASAHADVLADLLLGYVRIASPNHSLPMALYDPTAAAALVCKESMTWRDAYVAAECVGQHTRGMTVVEFRVPRKGLANAQVASVVDEALVRDLVMRALGVATGRRP